jgi:hypothetical protein
MPPGRASPICSSNKVVLRPHERMRVRENPSVIVTGTPVPHWSGRPGGLPSEAPTDPDVRIFRIRLFGPRFRYATFAGRMRGSGNG